MYTKETNFEKLFEFRNILPEETSQAVEIEKKCFPDNEACSEEMMKERIEIAPELFLVAVEKESGKIAGFINGLATDDFIFRDDFFTNAKLYKPDGRNVMILGLDVLPKYRKQGLATELMRRYFNRECEKGRRFLVLTCHESMIDMYYKMGFKNQGLAESTWGGEEWYEMNCFLRK